MPEIPARRLIVCGLFIFALAVRLIGSRWGLPSSEHWFSYHPDEREIATAAGLSLNPLNGDWNPDFFNYPSLYIYLVWFTHFIASGLGLTTPSSPTVPWPILHDITLAGRVVSAVLGAATVPLVFDLTRQIIAQRAAIIAAVLCALAPALVQHSHFATVDIAATFFVTLCLWLTVCALNDNDNLRGWMWAAFVAGLAASTKYNAIVVFAAPLCALWMAKAGLRYFGFTFAALISGFLIGCPFSVLSFRQFWGSTDPEKQVGFAYELLVHPRIGSGDIFIGTGNGWLYHLTFNLPFALTLPLLIVALSGVYFAVRDRENRRKWAPILAFAGIYFVSLGTSQVRFMRYVLPLIPVLCVFAALAILHLRRFQLAAATALSAVVFIGATNVLYPFVQKDARDVALEIPIAEQTQQVIGLVDRPWFGTPPFVPQNAPMSKEFTEAITPSGDFLVRPFGFDAARLKSESPCYFVMSEYDWAEKQRLGDSQYRQFMNELEARYSLEKSLKVQAPWALPGRDFVPHDYLYPNPEIRVYRRR